MKRRDFMAATALSGSSLGLLSAGPAGAAAADAGALVLGINTLWGPGDADTLRARFRKVRTLGIREVRLDWEWRQAEADKGRYQWKAFDTLVQAAQAEGVNLLPIVHYAPAWALVSGRKPADLYEMAPDEDFYADYARFLLACVQRYGPGGNAPVPFTPIRHWQVWNEPNLKQFWGPRPKAKDYARLLKITAETVAPVRDRIQLVHAGLSKSDIEFMWHLWDAEPKHGDRFDVMAVHSYVYDGKDGVRNPEALDEDEKDTAPMGFIGNPRDGGHLAKVFNLQMFMHLRGARGKPIWITEMGYFVANHPLGLTEAQQGERLRRTLDFIQKRLTRTPYGSSPRNLPTGVERVYWFSLEDYPSPEGLGTFGVFRPDGTLRPAGVALRDWKP